MTREEEIRQNAEEYAGNSAKHLQQPYEEYKLRYDAYIAGAHSRDEEIEKWKNLCDRLTIEKWQLQEKLYNLDN